MKPSTWGTDEYIGIALAGMILGAIGLGVWTLIMTIASDGRVDYCRIRGDKSHDIPVYIVEGHRNWRPDIVVAVALTPENANEKMKLLCPTQ